MKTLKVLLSSVLAGICIALGGCAYLSVDNKVVGALCFVVGLFTICTSGFRLFTGKVCYVFENDKHYAATLPVIWAGNFLGCALTAWLFGLTRIGSISKKAEALVSVKLGDSLMSVFILAAFCNVMIYIAVDGFKNIPQELGKYLALFFGVVVFILCGFEHCVANMFYISIAKAWSGRAVAFLLVNTAGNAVGGWLLPLFKKLSKV